ncbi:hypothetical protein ACFQI7_28095 [Paenibacillus allorhizosphaerae]|uniref:SnoaL-like domain-containing protein n=1 Tax=Paenibacillus allorhizosphaerae TaxID=2849866 RepID=A0ABN7TQK6_9BACL|nr:hypothetical protein [Paenibacillus allorhizosphaerae]CAG7651547.1 hypothetical protein PAECIP111802_04991 [Paenibacillus allorhizosphaerae]
MKIEYLLQLIRSVHSGKADEVFKIVNDSFGVRAAAEALSVIFQDDQTYRFLADTLGNDAEVEQVLLSIWDEDRFAKVRSGSPEFFLYISLTSYLTGEGQAHQYRIGASIRLSKGKPVVWFHHIVTHERLKDPEACVTWDNLTSEEQALWSLLVSKILSLPESWFIDAVKTSNEALLVPYDLSAYE